MTDNRLSGTEARLATEQIVPSSIPPTLSPQSITPAHSNQALTGSIAPTSVVPATRTREDVELEDALVDAGTLSDLSLNHHPPLSPNTETPQPALQQQNLRSGSRQRVGGNLSGTSSVSLRRGSPDTVIERAHKRPRVTNISPFRSVFGNNILFYRNIHPLSSFTRTYGHISLCPLPFLMYRVHPFNTGIHTTVPLQSDTTSSFILSTIPYAASVGNRFYVLNG